MEKIMNSKAKITIASVISILSLASLGFLMVIQVPMALIQLLLKDILEVRNSVSADIGASITQVLKSYHRKVTVVQMQVSLKRDDVLLWWYCKNKRY